MAEAPVAFIVEEVALADLNPHPRNYRQHPPDEIEHILHSIETHGLYRNIVIAQDNTILAGHGVVQALRTLQWPTVAVRRLPLDPQEPRALKVLAGDNEIGHLAEIDDRALSELLKEIADTDLDGLMGTGYDAAMLANLVFVTRPEAEVPTLAAAAHWAGMPEYDEGAEPLQVVVSLRTEADRAAFLDLIQARPVQRGGSQRLSVWWPAVKRNDLGSLRFTEQAE